MNVYSSSFFYNVICWHDVPGYWCRRTCIAVMLAANPGEEVGLSREQIRQCLGDQTVE